MRLAVVASHPIQYQAPLLREMARRREVMVYFAHRANRQDQGVAGYGVDFEWDVDLLAGYPHTFLDNVAKSPGLERFDGCDTPGISSELAKLRPHALLVMGWHLKCYWQAIWAAKRAGIPVLVRGDSHLETPRSRLKRAAKSMAYPVALRAFDAALYVGDRSRQYWEHYHYPRSRMFFSPHCVDNDWFAARATAEAGARLRERHGILPSAKVFLFVGRLIGFKRASDIISAASRMEEQPPVVLIAGAGPDSESIMTLARANGVKLVHQGFCNQSALPAVYRSADALVLPSEHETWGLVANEAIACGIPVIVSEACGCAPDLAADGAAGYVVPVGDVAALARAMSSLALHPPSRAAIAATAARYSIQAAADGIEAATGFVSRSR